MILRLALVATIASLFTVLALADGETCTEIAQCGENEYCNLQYGTCLGSDPHGSCRFVNPLTGCTHVWMPVCGCDLETYSNACFAEINYASLLYIGECRHCTGGQNDCQADELCRATEGNCAAFEGVCVPLTAECSTSCHATCGCDGKTYDSRCAVALSGLSVAHSGACEDPDDGLVTGVVFDEQDALGWSPESNVSHYNLYREIVSGSPTGAGPICYVPGLIETSIDLLDDPPTGELWMFQVASVTAGQEGPLGRQADCAERIVATTCP